MLYVGFHIGHYTPSDMNGVCFETEPLQT